VVIGCLAVAPAMGAAKGNGKVAGARAPQGGMAGTIVLQERAGQPLRDLTAAQLSRFLAGQQDYVHSFSVPEGLGPIFNKASCGNCHNNPIGGPGAQTVTRFGMDNKGEFDPLESLGGSLLQVSGISELCTEVVPPEADIVRMRITNSSLAFGLVEAIPDADLLANETSPPPGVTGRAHMVAAFEDPPASPLHVGRMGWKAQVATVLTFSADAAQNELGFSNRFVPFDNAPNGDAQLLGQCDTVVDPEDGPDGSGQHFIDRVTDFQRFLAPPPQTPKTGMAGEAVFNSIGCNACHVASFTTSNAPAETALQNKAIRPYSDFLLHDMGLLGDGVTQGDAEGQEMRTPALWGVRTRNPMLHDGRASGSDFATRVTSAIGWHNVFGSEAQAAGAAFDALGTTQKNQVIAFLDSLGRAEFDHDGDNLVLAGDFGSFRTCYAGGPYTPDDACAISDIDQDGDVDNADFDYFLQAWDGPRRDCNDNDIMDITDILLGTLPDVNQNAIADGCEPTCDADTDGNGVIDIDDYTEVILSWGPCDAIPAPCPGDINLDDQVNIDDFTAIVLGWGGPCP